VVTLLTKSTTFLLGPIATILGLIMNGIYEFFHIFGIQNIALSIFVFTFITKTIMLPLTIKQQKFTKLSSRMNPELQKIQAKYKGKKDEASLKKQQAETQAIYQKYGASPTAGCLPMLITLPIMFALYSVINNIPAYVTQVKELYETVAIPISGNGEYQGILTTLAEGLRVNIGDLTNVDKVIDVLAKFGTEKWDLLAQQLSSIGSTVSASAGSIQKVNNFLGLNIVNPPGLSFPGIIIPILAMALQFVQTKQLNVKNTSSNKDNPAASAMSSMSVVMPIMSGVFCITLPTGVGLYWIATSVYAIIQQYFVNKYMDHVDVEELIEKSAAKASKKRVRKAAITGTSLQEMATKQTKSIDTTVSEKRISSNNADVSEEMEETVPETVASENSKQKPNSPGSISEIANLLKNRSNEKGDK